jgi:surface protein
VVQSLDNDNNLSNGIFIDEDTKNKINLNATLTIIDANITQLKTIMTDTGKNLILERDAREHYKKTLLSLKLKPQFTPFITVWETTTTDENITIPINLDYKRYYDYTIDWGDGEILKNVNGNAEHTYAKVGEHTVKIYGKFPTIQVNNIDNNAKKLKFINLWGDIEWKDFHESFKKATNLKLNTTDTPNLSNVTNMSFMFWWAKSLNQPLNDWDVSNVTNMSHMFTNAEAFNQPLDKWNVSNVTDMNAIFHSATVFNQPLNNWDVSNVTDMQYMFTITTAFNQPLNDWNVSNVISMTGMFYGATAFTNQNLSTWNVKNGIGHSCFMQASGGGNTEPKWN